jgi:hypothetical protein
VARVGSHVVVTVSRFIRGGLKGHGVRRGVVVRYCSLTATSVILVFSDLSSYSVNDGVFGVGLYAIGHFLFNFIKKFSKENSNEFYFVEYRGLWFNVFEIDRVDLFDYEKALAISHKLANPIGKIYSPLLETHGSRSRIFR